MKLEGLKQSSPSSPTFTTAASASLPTPRCWFPLPRSRIAITQPMPISSHSSGWFAPTAIRTNSSPAVTEQLRIASAGFP